MLIMAETFKHHYMDVDLHKRDREGKSLLHHAVMCNNTNILEELLLYCNKYRINVDIPDKVTKITYIYIYMRFSYISLDSPQSRLTFQL